MNLSKIKIREIFPGFEGKFIHGEKISCVFWDVKKNAKVNSHKHHHEHYPPTRFRPPSSPPAPRPPCLCRT